ncbi:unnamed protein product [Paramecium sonneborni]|uniref:Uncharacterized protein n=1 Tax=Paramecium sonneborni TaxID=65129 RepID=A0A8S1P723_9CILI|nr:unnamed protein product [Paramecium sonneborni]
MEFFKRRLTFFYGIYSYCTAIYLSKHSVNNFNGKLTKNVNSIQSLSNLIRRIKCNQKIFKSL